MRSALIGALVLAATPALAGRGKPCDSCETCTTALAQDGAKVALQGPLEASGVCITIAGAGAWFDGGRHAISGAADAVVVEGADAFVNHVRVTGGQRGVTVRGANTTVHDLRTENTATAVEVAASGFRLVRAELKGGTTGVAFGAALAGACDPKATLKSPGAVLRHTSISGMKVGVHACEAVPVISDATLEGNGVGLLQGAAPPVAGATGPAGAHDPCVCAPSLDDVRPGTTLFYSSGCGGCKVHEGFLPDVRQRGHDVRLRESGKENRAKTASFDAYTRRCAPEIMDAIGIPGCVPNYACVADGTVAKRRGDNDRLVFDARLNSADDVSGFAARCVSAAEGHFGGPGCTGHALWRSRVCGNEVDVVSARPIAGDDNHCGSVQGAGDATGCAPCGAVAPKAAPAGAPKAAPAKTRPSSAARPSSAPASVASPASEAPASEASPPSTSPSESAVSVPWWIPAGVLGFAALLGLLVVRRRR